MWFWRELNRCARLLSQAELTYSLSLSLSHTHTHTHTHSRAFRTQPRWNERVHPPDSIPQTRSLTPRRERGEREVPMSATHPPVIWRSENPRPAPPPLLTDWHPQRARTLRGHAARARVSWPSRRRLRAEPKHPVTPTPHLQFYELYLFIHSK